MRNMLAILVAVALVSLAGCAKLSDTQTKDIARNDPPWVLEIPAFKSGVKIEVKVESNGGKLWACLFPADKEDVAVNSLVNDKKPAAALAWADNSDSLSLSATFAPNQEGKLYIKNVATKPATVKVSIVGR
jgi:hypothetical protein